MGEIRKHFQLVARSRGVDEAWKEIEERLSRAEEVVGDVDNALRAGADEELWPPGMTRGEAISLIIKKLEERHE